MLLARADIAPEGLEAVLREKGWTPVRVDAYRTELASEMSKKAAWALRKGEVDAVTFTSASTVRGFVGMGGAGAMGEALRSPRIVCIGPVTADHARAEGLPVDAVAHPHTIEGLVAALERLFAPGPRHRKETG